MKCTLFLLLILSLHSSAQQEWKRMGDKISTAWSDKLDPSHPLPDYPRPQMVRKEWKNLNGLWDYAILPRTIAMQPAWYEGKVLVPFAIESSLSGVGKTVGKDSVLWYHTTIDLAKPKDKNTLLQFGAVDWECTVWVNGKECGMHRGGYDPFTIDITTALIKGAKQDIVIRVWDPSDDGPQPRGKQVKSPHGIWYTSVTGIWQTVWIETVPMAHVSSIMQTPDVDRSSVVVKATVEGAGMGDKVEASIWDGNTQVAQQILQPNQETVIPITSVKLWSPSTPHLYNIKYKLLSNNKFRDEVTGYFGMRKISVKLDANGIQRMMLNDQALFQFGPLDQGWWPDGLYTAPTDEALKFDIEQTKAMGFNMIRKHVKVEPARWYYYCDLLGIMVWQDMPSGDLGNQWESRPGIYGRATDQNRSAESELIYRSEWKEIVTDLHNFPSIVVWVPFNEAWGQFKTKDIVNWTMQYDPSRLVNTASGGNFETVGPIIDLHNYPEPLMPDPALYGHDRVLVLGEYGGLGLPLEGHTWQDKNNWGYQSFKSQDELLTRYSEFVEMLSKLIDKGLSAAVYTQTTDVEVECNGLMTYDRKVVKLPVEKLQALHALLYRTPSGTQ